MIVDENTRCKENGKVEDGGEIELSMSCDCIQLMRNEEVYMGDSQVRIFP